MGLKETMDSSERMSRYIRLLCGYRGTGKDTLCHELNTGEFKFNWAVYVPPTYQTPLRLEHGCRLAFADCVKSKIKEKLQLPECFDVEREKEETLPVSGKSFREHCIEYGQKKRQVDEFYWPREAFRQLDDTNVITVSDWRFWNEYLYALSVGEVATFRLFRRAVPIPPKVNTGEEDPEHSLDEFTTDFLVVPYPEHQEEFRAAVEVFPQYSNFTFHRLLGPENKN